MSAPSADRTPLVAQVEPGTTFKVIGLGGVGCHLARGLALFLRSRDVDLRLVLADGDVFEADNAARMFFARPGSKARVVRDDLKQHLVDSRVTLTAVDEFVKPANLQRLVREGDVVLLCVDNHATRKLVSDHCATLRDVTLISGGNDGVDPSATPPQRGTFCSVQVYLRRDGQDLSPSLSRYHEEIEQPSAPGPWESCSVVMQSTPQILFANLATASAMLNTMWLHLCSALHYSELCLDIQEGRMRPSGVGLIDPAAVYAPASAVPARCDDGPPAGDGPRP